MVYEFMLDHRMKYIKYSGEFQHIFSRNLKDFWDPVFGFDVLEFDTFISPSVGESTYNAIIRLYDEPTAEMVRNLI